MAVGMLQLHLIPEVEPLIAERNRLRQALHAQNTERGYSYDWASYEVWCARKERRALPATPETVSLYLTGLITRGLKVATATRHAAAIVHHHRFAGFDSPATEQVWGLLKAAQRLRNEQPKQKRALTMAELRAIAARLTAKGTPRAIRDRAILVVGFASALRRSNLCALMLDDLEFQEQGIVLRIRREKQDQNGRGRLIGIPPGQHDETCPVRCLRAWLSVRGSHPGALFTGGKGQPLRPCRIAALVQANVARLGLDPQQYGAHSLRAGFITEAGEAGASELLIAAQTGHRSMDTLRRYFRRRDLFKANACSLIGL